ncbi:MAG: UPF0280 family protein [Desulfonatronovibrio sp.]
MKHLNHHRSYRNLCSPESDETASQIVVEQSDLYIISKTDLRSHVLDRLNKIRRDIKGYILLSPEFSHSLIPVETDEKAPAIVRAMAGASRLFGVGPMAAVAGAIAQDIADHGSKISPDILVENGGDIFMHSSRDRVVGLLPHPDEPLALGIKISGKETPCAVCSSSATIGHSLSLGQGDLVTVRSRSGAVADAGATFLCNMLRSRKSLKKINQMQEELQQKGITGVLAQLDHELVVWGEMELTMT